MENPSDVIWDNVSDIIKLMKTRRFHECIGVSKSMVTLSTKLIMVDENIICKIISDGLENMNAIMDRTEIPKSERDKFIEQFIEVLEKIQKSHETDDQSGIYGSLKELQGIFMTFKKNSVLHPSSKYSKYMMRRFPSSIHPDEEDEEEDEE